MKILKSKNQTLLLENYPPFDVHSQKKRFFMISHCSILKIQRDIFLLEYPFFYFLLIFYFFTFFLLFNIFLSSAKSRLFLVQTPKKSFPKMNTEKLPNWLLPSMASNVQAQPTLQWGKEVRQSASSADSAAMSPSRILHWQVLWLSLRRRVKLRLPWVASLEA